MQIIDNPTPPNLSNFTLIDKVLIFDEKSKNLPHTSSGFKKSFFQYLYKNKSIDEINPWLGVLNNYEKSYYLKYLYQLAIRYKNKDFLSQNPQKLPVYFWTNHLQEIIRRSSAQSDIIFLLENIYCPNLHSAVTQGIFGFSSHSPHARHTHFVENISQKINWKMISTTAKESVSMFLLNCVERNPSLGQKILAENKDTLFPCIKRIINLAPDYDLYIKAKLYNFILDVYGPASLTSSTRKSLYQKLKNIDNPDLVKEKIKNIKLNYLILYQTPEHSIEVQQLLGKLSSYSIESSLSSQAIPAKPKKI